jgi:hypothetical protein
MSGVEGTPEAASSFETHRFAMLLRMRSSSEDELLDPHGEERAFARLEP